MAMIDFKNRLKKQIAERLGDIYPLEPDDIEFTPTPNAALGELALAFPFQLARRLKTNPRALASEIAGRLLPLEGVERLDIAGAGYINLFLDRTAFFAAVLRDTDRTVPVPEEDKIIIEHTNINPNKAAHVGHLRNACLGDTLVRCRRHRGENVEVQNYVDDTGVQVVDVVFGLMELEGISSPAELDRIPGKFDYYCWDLYARISPHLAAHPESGERKAGILKKIEHGEDPEAGLAHAVSRRILRAHLATMSRLGISYDVLPCESSILRLAFWEKAFERLKERQAIHYVESGDNAGCWVMRLEDEPDREKIIVRSDGTVTYVGKDIAYQLWKFGLLDRDFYYEPFIEDAGRPVWITTSSPRPGSPSFGRGSRVYNVIDSRQAYLQKVVVQGLKSLKYESQAAKSIHFSYEMVALSPKSLEELGYQATDEEKDRAFLEVSGRKGLGVKADDLLDRLEEKARAEVSGRNPELDPEAAAEVARQVACGALRYFMLKFSRNSLIVFDFDEVLSFEGETGPYLQYTAVRMNSIFRKLRERDKTAETALHTLETAPPSLTRLQEKELADTWDLVTVMSSIEEDVVRSVAALEFSHLARFAFTLCQKINSYYHRYPILSETDPELRNIRLLTISAARRTLGAALALMGIPIPEKM